jgi:hypothetical protein
MNTFVEPQCDHVTDGALTAPSILSVGDMRDGSSAAAAEKWLNVVMAMPIIVRLQSPQNPPPALSTLAAEAASELAYLLRRRYLAHAVWVDPVFYPADALRGGEQTIAAAFSRQPEFPASLAGSLGQGAALQGRAGASWSLVFLICLLRFQDSALPPVDLDSPVGDSILRLAEASVICAADRLDHLEMNCEAECVGLFDVPVALERGSAALHRRRQLAILEAASDHRRKNLLRSTAAHAEDEPCRRSE